MILHLEKSSSLKMISALQKSKITTDLLRSLEVANLQINLETSEISTDVSYAKNSNFRKDLLKQVYDLYISGNLYPKRWFKTLGFQNKDQLRHQLKKIGPLLSKEQFKSFYSTEQSVLLKQHFIEKFGVDNPSKSAEIKTKKFNTFKKNFSTDEKLSELAERRKQTFLQNFGSDNPSKVQEIKERKLMTFRQNFATDESIEQLVQRRKETCLERYGVDNPSKVQEIKDKKSATFLKNYGVDNVFKSAEFVQAMRKRKAQSDPRFAKVFDESADLDFLFENYCKAQAYVNAHRLNLLPKSDFLTEIKMHEILQELNIEMHKTRSVKGLVNESGNNFELDFYNADLKLAIEVNGIYNHSKDGRNPDFPDNFHFYKWQKCQDVGITLLSFTCIEVLQFPEFVKNVVKFHLEELSEIPEISEELCKAINLSTDEILNSANYMLLENFQFDRTFERLIDFNGRKFRFVDCGRLKTF